MNKTSTPPAGSLTKGGFRPVTTRERPSPPPDYQARGDTRPGRWCLFPARAVAFSQQPAFTLRDAAPDSPPQTPKSPRTEASGQGCSARRAASAGKTALVSRGHPAVSAKLAIRGLARSLPERSHGPRAPRPAPSTRAPLPACATHPAPPARTHKRPLGRVRAREPVPRPATVRGRSRRRRPYRGHEGGVARVGAPCAPQIDAHTRRAGHPGWERPPAAVRGTAGSGAQGPRRGGLAPALPGAADH